MPPWARRFHGLISWYNKKLFLSFSSQNIADKRLREKPHDLIDELWVIPSRHKTRAVIILLIILLIKNNSHNTLSIAQNFTEH